MNSQQCSSGVFPLRTAADFCGDVTVERVLTNVFFSSGLYCFTSAPPGSPLPNNTSSGWNIRSIQLGCSTALRSWREEIVISPTWLMAVIAGVVWVPTMRDCGGNRDALSVPLAAWCLLAASGRTYVDTKADPRRGRKACNRQTFGEWGW